MADLEGRDGRTDTNNNNNSWLAVSLRGQRYTPSAVLHSFL